MERDEPAGPALTHVASSATAKLSRDLSSAAASAFSAIVGGHTELSIRTSRAAESWQQAARRERRTATRPNPGCYLEGFASYNNTNESQGGQTVDFDRDAIAVSTS